MIVGGIGYAINMLAYTLLTLNLNSAPTTFLGQHFYLAPFVVSSLLAIMSNYILNKVWTFKGWSEQRMGALRYLVIALATLLLARNILLIILACWLIAWKLPAVVNESPSLNRFSFKPYAAILVLAVLIGSLLYAQFGLNINVLPGGSSSQASEGTFPGGRPDGMPQNGFPPNFPPGGFPNNGGGFQPPGGR
jgi:putative flippase GtrA